jgi:rubrerythrin
MSRDERSGGGEPDSKDDREYSSAVFLCPKCNNVFTVRPFKLQNGEGKCPRCGQSTEHFVTKD